jgi:hypothetical protein
MPTTTPIALLLALSTALGAPLAALERGPAPRPDVRDCNGNGIEDAVDIAFGTSSDVNQNGVPDECERS